MKSINFFKNNFIYLLFTIYFFLGIFLVKDYGITVDEEFHRYSGLYWLNYIAEITHLDNLQFEVTQKLNGISGHTLPNPKDFSFYGVTFDLPLAFLEIIFKIEDSRNIFLLRHYFNFFIFFISSIYFFLLLKDRFKDNKILFIGIILFLTSPRIFGDSFYNNKDIIFLSFVTINIYYLFKFFDNSNLNNLFLFSLFSSLTCATRIVGIFLPFSFIIYILVSKDQNSSWSNIFKKIITFNLIFFTFLILFWPYLWANPVSNLFLSLKIFSNYPVEFKMLFNGHYINSKFLPLNYVPIWISITTPLITLFLFSFGYFILLKRFFIRLINIRASAFSNDFWKSQNEKKDFFIFLNFSAILFYIILSNTDLYNGWRHLYFLHIFLSYIACIGVYKLFLNFRKIKYVLLILTILPLTNLYGIIKFHPFQSFYFNELLINSKKKDFEVDYWGLAGKKFLENLIINNKNLNELNLAVASFIPLERSLKMIKNINRSKINIVGQNYEKADYIFHNNISEVDKSKNKKYSIPENFKLVDEFYIKGFMIYQLFKKI